MSGTDQMLSVDGYYLNKYIKQMIGSVQFSCSVMLDYLQPHRRQDTRTPCPSATPAVYSSSYPSSRWCHPIISFSVIPFSSSLQYFPASANRCWQFDLWFLCLFYTQIVHLEVHIVLKSSLKDFEHYLASMWNKCNCAAVWTFFDIVLLWDWNDNSPFPVLWPLLSFPNLLAYWVQDFHSFIFQDLK